MTTADLATIIVAVAMAFVVILDRLDRKRKDKIDEEARHNADADRQIELKDGRIEDLEQALRDAEDRIKKMEEARLQERELAAQERERAEARHKAQQAALRFIFDELGLSDRCMNAPGCDRRIAPGQSEGKGMELVREALGLDDLPTHVHGRRIVDGYESVG